MLLTYHHVYIGYPVHEKAKEFAGNKSMVKRKTDYLNLNNQSGKKRDWVLFTCEWLTRWCGLNGQMLFVLWNLANLLTKNPLKIVFFPVNVSFVYLIFLSCFCEEWRLWGWSSRGSLKRGLYERIMVGWVDK